MLWRWLGSGDLLVSSLKLILVAFIYSIILMCLIQGLEWLVLDRI